MSDEPTFEQIKPERAVPEDVVAHPWLIRMSDWPLQHAQELLTRIEGAFKKAKPKGPLPTVLVVEDIGSYEAAYQAFLTALTEAGAFVLEPEDETEAEAVRSDPLRFAREQLVAAQQAVAMPGPVTAPDYQKWLGTADAAALTPTRGALLSRPSDPDAYREFAKALTRLPDDALKDMMKPRD